MSLYSKYDYTQTIRNSQYIYNRAGLLSSQYIGHKLTPKLTISRLGLFVPARRVKGFETLWCLAHQLLSKLFPNALLPLTIIHSVRHGLPWGFFGLPMAVPEKNCTQRLGHGKFMATGMGFGRIPTFLRVLQGMGFCVTRASGYG